MVELASLKTGEFLLRGRSFSKKSTLKVNNLLPVGANYFLLEKPLFRRDLVCMKANKKSQMLLLINGEESATSPLKVISVRDAFIFLALLFCSMG